jgi:hypothetical protein
MQETRNHSFLYPKHQLHANYIFSQILSLSQYTNNSSPYFTFPVMLFSKAIFADIVDTDMYRDETIFIDIAYLREHRNSNKRRDTMIRFFFLSCTMGTSTSNTARTMLNGNYGSNKKAKNSATTTYNRYFLVADLQNPPHCAAILPRSTDEASRLLSIVNGQAFVGVPFCCAEPQTLGDFLRVLQLPRSPFVLLKSTNHHLQSTEDKMTMPRSIGETNYFNLSDKKYRSTESTFAPDKHVSEFSATGKKENWVAPANIPPTILPPFLSSTLSFLSRQQFIVVRTPISVNTPNTLNTTTVIGFCSLHTTKVFFQNYEKYCTGHTTADQEKNASI